MNKYLSYEKSRKLAELGYKPETEKTWCLNLDEIGVYPSLLVPSYVDHNFSILAPAPDCHDLLMELQKYEFSLSFYSNSNPVEALGAALIKILEEKS